MTQSNGINKYNARVACFCSKKQLEDINSRELRKVSEVANKTHVADVTPAINEKGIANLQSLVFIGRSEKIRTSDPHNPIVVRYQAALRSDDDFRLEQPVSAERIIPKYSGFAIGDDIS